MSLPADTETYMVHRPPLRLVQKLLCVDGDYAEAETVLNVGDVGVDADGNIEATVLFELVAQTYAAAKGYRDRQNDKPASLGYLVGASDFRIERVPSAGRRLLIKVKSSCSFEDFYLLDGQVLCDDHVAARGALKIWVQPETKQPRQ